jgi:hypothetical protein
VATLQHPGSLKAFQQYGQACSILTNTSRATNPAWYQDALAQNLQLHIRVDGVDVSTFYYDRNRNLWENGPDLTHDVIKEPAKLSLFIEETIQYARSNEATSLGVILYIADEFATTELKPEFNHSVSLAELRNAAILDPNSILEDSSIVAAQASWRVLPYATEGCNTIGTTVTITTRYAPLMAMLREAGENENFPIVTHALSAPLVVIMGLSQILKPTNHRPFVAILQYPWFTVLAFFDEAMNLRLIRSLQHHGIHCPIHLCRNAIVTTNASLEFIDPDIFLLGLSQNINTTQETQLRIAFTNSRVEDVFFPSTPQVSKWCPEPTIASQTAVCSTSLASQTFTMLREEKWTLQNFLPTPSEIAEIYPSHEEMQLLRILRFARVAIFAIAALGIFYLCYGAIDLIRRPEWAFDSTQSAVIQDKLTQLSRERKKSDYWNNLLEDRSKAWASMESLSQMFPENAGILIKTYSQVVKPDNTPGKVRVGFVKEWKITGHVRDEALAHLNTLNTREGISAHFSEIARLTGNNSFGTGISSRNLVANLRTQENSSYKPIPPEEINDSDESTYPFTFDLTITQRFEATDPLAISVSKAP